MLQPFDAGKHRAQPACILRRDVRGLKRYPTRLQIIAHRKAGARGEGARKAAFGPKLPYGDGGIHAALPSTRKSSAAVQRASEPSDIVVVRGRRIAGRTAQAVERATPGGYHLDMVFRGMGYEIAGGLGVSFACPDREVIVMVGDGSISDDEFRDRKRRSMLGLKLTIVVLDNGGFGLHQPPAARDQAAKASTIFLKIRTEAMPKIDSPRTPQVRRRRQQGRHLGELKTALKAARTRRAHVRHRDRHRSLGHHGAADTGGCGGAGSVRTCRSRARAQEYETARKAQRLGD